MSTLNDNFGLSKEEVIEIIDKELEKNADILIGIDDPEVREMIDVLRDAIGKVIEENNKSIAEMIS